jgi:O-antigen/teichoic acid export membrane protein
MIVLAKLGSPETVGDFALALALTGPVMLFTQLSLRSIQVTDASRTFTLGDYLALRLTTTAAAMTVIVSGIVVVRATVFSGVDVAVSVILIVALAKAMDSVADVVFGEWQREERLDAVAVVYGLNGLASVAALSLAIWATGSLVWGAAGFLCGSAFALAVALSANSSITSSRLRPRWQVRTLAELARLALPLGPAMLLVALNGTVPRYFVAGHLGSRDLGVFAAISAVVLTGSIIVSATGQALSPRLAVEYAIGDRRGFLSLLRKFIFAAAGIGGCGVIVLIVSGKTLLSVLYTPVYADAADVMVIAMGASALGFVGSTLGYAMNAARRFSAQVPLFAVVLITTSGAAALLVPRYGIAGAAWAAVVGSSAQICGSVVVLFWALRAIPLVRERRR